MCASAALILTALHGWWLYAAEMQQISSIAGAAGSPAWPGSAWSCYLTANLALLHWRRYCWAVQAKTGGGGLEAAYTQVNTLLGAALKPIEDLALQVFGSWC